MTDFKTLSPAALFLGPAAKAFRGVATIFEVNGHQAAVLTPNNATLMTLCKEWGIKAHIANVAEPVVVVTCSITMEAGEGEGLGQEIDDGLGDGL